MGRKKICFVVSSVLTAKFFLRFHIEKLSEEYDVYLVGKFSKEDIESVSYLKLTGIKSIGIERNINIKKDLIAIKNFVSYIKEMQFDAIHSLAPKAGLIAAISGKIAGTKIRIHIFTGQVWHTKKGFFRFILKQLDKLIVLLNTKVLVDSHSQQEYLINEGIVNINNSLVLGKGSISGVDIKRFYPNIKLKKELKEELKIPSEVVVFLFMGRINRDKGIFDLAHAFKELLSTSDNVFLLIGGYDEGKCIEKVKAIVKNEKYFKYYGSTDFPENIIHAGDVFCLPSYREGFGTSVIEASSCKLPAICSDTYGLRDTIIDNETGLRHEVGNIKEITSKMKLLASDINLIQQFGENGFKYVNENFLASSVSDAWLRFYQKVLE